MSTKAGDISQRKRRILMDCAVNGTRLDIDLPLDNHESDGPIPPDVDLAYLRSITRDLVSIARQFLPEDANEQALDILAVHYKSARDVQRITWHVTYMDALRIPRSIVTDADTPEGAFFNVFWHHASILSPLRTTSVDDFCAVADSLHPILAQPLPDFSSQVVHAMSDIMRLGLQIAGGNAAARNGAPAVPHIEPVRDAIDQAPPLRAIGHGGHR